jgi:myo-inositol 2-dehydrogenase/D-chiro-inositol 1-dehydrogenase
MQVALLGAGTIGALHARHLAGLVGADRLVIADAVPGAFLTMTDGTLGVMTQTRHNPRGYDIRMELVGSNDAVSMGVGPHMPSRSLEPDAPPPARGGDSFLTRFETAYKAELETFLEVAAGRRPSPCTARDGLEAMRVSVAATRSVARGQAILLAAVA